VPHFAVFRLAIALVVAAALGSAPELMGAQEATSTVTSESILDCGDPPQPILPLDESMVDFAVLAGEHDGKVDGHALYTYDFAPGARIPMHCYPGQISMGVECGELLLTVDATSTGPVDIYRNHAFGETLPTGAATLTLSVGDGMFTDNATFSLTDQTPSDTCDVVEGKDPATTRRGGSHGSAGSSPNFLSECGDRAC